MVPVLFNNLMRRARHEFDQPHPCSGLHAKTQVRRIFLVRFQAGFERGFVRFRENYRATTAGESQARLTVWAFVLLILVSALLFPLLGRDFFP